MTSHRQCYGTMFSDTLHVSRNMMMEGKVFSFEIRSHGLAPSDRHLHTKLDEWDKCRKCHEFEHCYQFCMAKLVMETAITNQ
jgi:hypothetical protein